MLRPLVRSFSLRFPCTKRPLYYSSFNHDNNRNRFKFKDRSQISNGFRYLTRPVFMKAAAIIGGGFFLVYISNQEYVEMSGKTHFILFTPEMDAKLGKSSFRFVTSKQDILPPHHPYTQRVARVMERLLQVIPKSYYEKCVEHWTVVVSNDPKNVNAAALPGGYVVVYSGLLGKVTSDDELAAVLGHEMSHVILRHGIQSLSWSYLRMWITMIVSGVFDIPTGFSDTALTVALSLPYSRSREQEADYYGLMIMADACYDPKHAISFWENMQDNKVATRRNSSFNILSTHPMHNERIEALQRAMPEATLRREQRCGGPDQIKTINSFWKTL